MEVFADIKLAEVLATIFYALLGLALFIVSYMIIDKLTHFSLHQELAEKQNIAVAIVIAGVAIALALLLAAVIR